MRTTAALAAVVVVLGFVIDLSAGVTKIAPTIAEAGEPFNIIDTTASRLVDGSVAVFRLEGLEVVLPLRTRPPFNTGHGRLAADMFGGVYSVSVRPPSGPEFFVGSFTVIGPAAPTPSITPTTGAPGDAFTIVDALARIDAADIALFYAEGADPGASGVPADNVVVSADGTTLTGTVPFAAANDTQNFVAVRASVGAPSRFADLAFFVTHPPAIGTLYALVSPEGGTGGADTIARASVQGTGSLSFVSPPTATSGNGGLNVNGAGLAASLDGSLLFVSHNRSGQIEAFARQPDGSLISTGTATVANPGVIAAHPTLPVIYVVDSGPSGSTLKVFSYSAAGALSLFQTMPTANDLRGVTVSGGGWYVVTSHIGFTGPRTVDVYAVSGTGLLTFISSNLPVGAERLSGVQADGNHIYVEDLDRGIYAYEQNPLTGLLTPLNGGFPYEMSGVFLSDLTIAGGKVFTLSHNAGLAGGYLEAYPILDSGELGPRSTLPCNDNLQNLRATADGTLLFASSRNQQWIRTFSVAASVVTESADSPFTIPGLSPDTFAGRIIFIP